MDALGRIKGHGGDRVFYPGLGRWQNADFADEWKYVDETGRLAHPRPCDDGDRHRTIDRRRHGPRWARSRRRAFERARPLPKPWLTSRTRPRSPWPNGQPRPSPTTTSSPATTRASIFRARLAALRRPRRPGPAGRRERYGGQGSRPRPRAAQPRRARQGLPRQRPDLCARQPDLDHSSAPIERFGDDEQCRRWLPAMVSGETLGAFAMTEPAVGSDSFAATTTAERIDDDAAGASDGTKAHLTMGPRADVVLVFASTRPDAGRWGLSAFFVPTRPRPGSPNTRTGRRWACGRPRSATSTSTVSRSTATPLLGQVGAGASIFAAAIESERAYLFATSLGAMERQLDATVRLRPRRASQFGRPDRRLPGGLASHRRHEGPPRERPAAAVQGGAAARSPADRSPTSRRWPSWPSARPASRRASTPP